MANERGGIVAYDLCVDEASWEMHARVEIEQSEKTLEVMRECILFWFDGQAEIDAVNGDVTRAFLMMLGMALCSEDHWCLEATMTAFDELEGWCDLRGNFGVTLKSIEVERRGLERDDVGVEEVA